MNEYSLIVFSIFLRRRWVPERHYIGQLPECRAQIHCWGTCPHFSPNWCNRIIVTGLKRAPGSQLVLKTDRTSTWRLHLSGTRNTGEWLGQHKACLALCLQLLALHFYLFPRSLSSVSKKNDSTILQPCVGWSRCWWSLHAFESSPMLPRSRFWLCRKGPYLNNFNISISDIRA